MNKMNLKGQYTVVCTDANGNKKWEDVANNIIVNEGLDHLLDNGMTVPLYVFLKGAGSPANADTMASHASWAETTGYGNRPPFTPAAASGQMVTNAASKAVFNIVGSSTVEGAGLCTMNSGTGGVLISASSFSGGSRDVATADTLTVTYQLTVAVS